MTINNSQNSHTLSPHRQPNPTVDFLFNLGRCVFRGLKLYYGDVYWDDEAGRYRNSAAGRFVADWKSNLFT